MEKFPSNPLHLAYPLRQLDFTLKIQVTILIKYTGSVGCLRCRLPIKLYAPQENIALY